jgi:hypothetical protein
MPVILNEEEYAKRIIDTGEVGNKPTSTLFLLSRYFRQKMEYGEKKTEKELNQFMVNNYKNYIPAQWEDIIEDIAKKGKKYKLQKIDYIGITQKELDKISKVCNLKYEKLLFTMLCYAKLYNHLSETNNSWVNTDIRELYKIARVTVKYRNDKFLYLNDLEAAGLISFSNKNDNLNMKINFVDQFTDYVLKVDDFRELGYIYQQYTNNGSFTNCKECGRLIKKTNNKCLYCNDCKVLISARQKRDWDLKNRISEK